MSKFLKRAFPAVRAALATSKAQVAEAMGLAVKCRASNFRDYE
jgi:hypothetical protein